MENILSKPFKFQEAKKLLGTAYPRVSPTAFIKEMVQMRMLKQEGKSELEYRVAVQNLCKNGATWLAGKLYNLGHETVLVHRGMFMDQEHFWVELDGKFLDLTLIKFADVFPKFSVLDAREYTGESLYCVQEVMTFPKWEKHYKQNVV